LDAEDIEREKKKLPWGWGRFGKALEYLLELAEPGETLISTCIGVNPEFNELGLGTTNILLAVTDRRLLAVGTTLRGVPGKSAVVPYEGLTATYEDRKRVVQLHTGGKTAEVRDVAKQQFPDFVEALSQQLGKQPAG
jgi:hypothetical protein